MGTLRFFILLLFLAFLVGCNRQPTKMDHAKTPLSGSSIMAGKGGLLLKRFKSFEELKEVIQIEYFDQMVRITHSSDCREVTSELTTGVSQLDFLRAQEGELWDQLRLVFISPYAVLKRKDMRRAFMLSRRRGSLFGEGDVAFYDIAETMVHNISQYDVATMHPEDLSEKGYINTFNHINAQAFMTSIFSEKLADFVADTHERAHMPELITGEFTEDQLTDLDNGATDNYIDIVNNEWGQELGKLLRKRYNISRKTNWTPELLTDYLNDLQSYYGWAFQIAFEPFRDTDDLVIKFSSKINKVIKEMVVT